MGSAVFLYRDYAVTGLLSGGSWRASLPLANAQSPDLGVVARSTDATAASTQFRIDLGAIKRVGGVVVGPANLSPGASYRVRAYDDAAFSEVSFDTGVTLVPGDVIDWSTPAEWLEWENPDFWLGVIDVDDRENLPLFLGVVFPDELFTQHLLVEFFDVGNAAGYVEFGRVLCCRAWRPSLNFAPDNNSLGIQTNTDMQQSIDGNRAYWEHPQRRTWQCAFPMIPENEALDNVFPMGNSSGVSRQIFIIPDPDDVIRFRKRNFLATFKTAPAIAQLNVALGSTVLEFEEVL